MKHIFFYFLVLSVFFAVPLKAQRDLDLSMRWFNEVIYNPAATGNSFTTSFFAHGRQQWVGLDGAPSSQAFSFDTYVNEIHSGLGFTFMRDQIGVTSMTNVRFSYAYIMPISPKSNLAFGLSAGFLSWNKRASDASIEDPNEIQYRNLNEISPDFDFGIEFKGPLKVGLAARHLFVQSRSFSHLPKHTINFWMYASSRFNFNTNLSLEPLTSLSIFDGALRAEAGIISYFLKRKASNVYNDKFWVGATYRNVQSVAIFVGTAINERLRLGYAFDYHFGALSGVSKGGTHEVFIAYQFNRIFYKEPECPAFKNSKRIKR